MTTLAEIQGKAQAGATAEAELLLRGFLSALFGLDIAAVDIRKDTLSLNSVNGFIKLNRPEAKSGASTLFFKFHHEEGEEGLAEYYNSKLLAEAGFPVETPLYASTEIGKQVLLYPVKTSERMADICKRLENASEKEFAPVAAAQEALDKACCTRYLSTLHEATAAELAQEPILQLFYYRLIDDKKDNATQLAGRYRQFYAGKKCALPGVTLDFEELACLKWRINGITYGETLNEAFLKALKILSPAAHLAGNTYPALTSHGDAHNGNVWYNAGNPPALSLFDPAFAGKHIPALLAEIKPTFHNIFAHPLWLYDAQEADTRLEVSCTIEGGYINVMHNWRLSPLREAFLRSKRDFLWKPLLNALKEKGSLPANWQDYMRASLFCCPTLVMNLCAGAGTQQNAHTPKTSLLGFAIAIMLSTPPVEGRDVVSDFFSELQKGV